MEWYLKIPSLNLDRWAPGRNWPELLHSWKQEGFAGLIVPHNMGLSGSEEGLRSFVNQAKEHGLGIWLTVAVFQQPAYYQTHEESRAVPIREMELPSRFGPICPTSEAFEVDFETFVLELLRTAPVDTLLLDHLRLPYPWERWGVEVQPDAWPPFCYCERCRGSFAAESGKPVEEATLDEWSAWQQKRIAEFLHSLRKILEREQPSLRVGLQMPPFVSPSRWSLRHEWAGLNLATLQRNLDFLSPLLYASVLGWSEDELLAYLLELLSHVRIPVIPSLQVVRTPWDRSSPSQTVKEDSLIERLDLLGIGGISLFHAAAFL